MLQQTTSRAVIPYFEKFMDKFPTLQTLAESSEGEVRQAWAGLGYYSRASHLWRAAKELAKLPRFPRSAEELSKFPGFGPYTSRAVSSLAFGEKVGVVDGNVIRVLSRHHDLRVEWWKPTGRQQIQFISDAWACSGSSDRINQALMELGATICTAKNPTCLICPVRKNCLAFKNKTVNQRPLARPRRVREIWSWHADVIRNGDKILMSFSKDLPFSRKHPSLPGVARQLLKKPDHFDYQHSITHHDIFVSVKFTRGPVRLKAEQRWVPIAKLAEICPTSLVSKALEIGQKSRAARAKVRAE